MYTSTNIANQTCLRLLKKFSLFVLVVSLLIYSPLSVNASDVATESSGNSSGEYVTIEVPLSWTLNHHINLETGEEYSDAQSGSVSNYINVIPEASYNVVMQGDGAGYNSGCISFYYSNLNYISYQSLWNMSTGSKSAALKIPADTTEFRLATDMVATGDYQQNLLNLSITLSATYLEEHDLTEETLLDVVYRDDSTVIDDATNKLTSEFEQLQEQEDYLIEESKYIFDDFFTSFNWSALEEYLSGFQFIGTWFGNLYNSHSAVGVIVGMSAGLTLLFILLRFRGH